MNEYMIRNGFSEADAPKILKMKGSTRDYVNTEYNGRVHAISIRPTAKSKKSPRLIFTRKRKYTGQIPMNAAQPNKS